METYNELVKNLKQEIPAENPEHRLVISDRQWNGKDCFMESWFMSCSVLQRGLENYIFEQMINLTKSKNCEQITGEVIPSGRNDLVHRLYENLGFTRKDEKWITDVHTAKLLSHFIEPETNE